MKCTILKNSKTELDLKVFGRQLSDCALLHRHNVGSTQDGFSCFFRSFGVQLQVYNSEDHSMNPEIIIPFRILKSDLI